jgi:hypothetical protein
MDEAAASMRTNIGKGIICQSEIREIRGPKHVGGGPNSHRQNRRWPPRADGIDQKTDAICLKAIRLFAIIDKNSLWGELKISRMGEAGRWCFQPLWVHLLLARSILKPMCLEIASSLFRSRDSDSDRKEGHRHKEKRKIMCLPMGELTVTRVESFTLRLLASAYHKFNLSIA